MISEVSVLPSARKYYGRIGTTSKASEYILATLTAVAADTPTYIHGTYIE